MVAVGLFDGVHRGHRYLLETTRDWAAELRAVAVVVTFAPHPEELLHGNPPPLVVSPAHRVRLIHALGIARAWLFPLTAEIMRMTAREFVAQYVRDALGAVGLIVGFDHRLGSDRAGYATLHELGAELGVEVRQCAPFLVGGQPVSSTAVRKAIVGGDLARAEQLLGRRVSVMGRVVEGKKIGRTLGFPTANLQTTHEAVVPCGIYAGEVTIDGRTLRAAVSVGAGPTVQPPAVEAGRGAFQERLHTVEVHVIDYAGELLGKELEVRIERKLRDEQRFASIDALVAQIRADVDNARRGEA